MESVTAEQLKDLDPALFEFAPYSENASESRGYSNYAYWRSTWRSFSHNRTAMTLLIGLIVLLCFTFVQPLLPAQKSPTQVYTNAQTGRQERNHAPCAEFWFGTNTIGQD
ncbi:MAG: hypothetical protein J6D22_04410, partial [Pyramidobacter sp.]|nr:hypothetical protein [Pyramidobacter sp.]